MPEMTFTIDKRHAENARKWINQHPCKTRKSKKIGVIGGKTSYVFTNTSIGQLQIVRCGCRKEKLLNGDDL